MSYCPTDLRASYREGRLLPFVGAGVSMSVRWKGPAGTNVSGPSWKELVDQASELLGFTDPFLARVRGTDLQILEYFKLKHGDETALLTNWLTKLMNPPDDALLKSIIHVELSQLLNCKTFYTTNYDDFLERALELYGRPTSVVALEMQMGVTNQKCEVIKFHGDLNHPKQIVLTESDYERRLALSTPLDLRLRSDLLGRVIHFIGYSFRDPNVSYLFRLFTDEFFDKSGGLRGTRAYIITPDPSDFERELFGARRIEVLPISGERISEDIAELLKEMRS